MTADNPAPVSNFVMRDAPDKLVNDVEALGRTLDQVKASIGRVIFGQHDVIEQTLITVMSGGHVLLIGVPGLAKTKLVETLGVAFGLDEARIQCTPDLMPADIIGSEVLEEADSGRRSFRFIRGPVFCQLLMADEINRASPRTQSALLQAMQEKRVSVAGQYHPLPEPFHVLATQNPLEQEGTYPLPEAQLDRFLLQVNVGYPDLAAERKMLMATTGVAEEKAVLVDLRSEEEWDKGHLAGSIFLPVTALTDEDADLAALTKDLPRDKVLYTFCVMGIRADAAGEVLEDAGFTVRVLEPGYKELVKAGFKRARKK